MAEWTWVLAQPLAATGFRELTMARARTVTWRVDASMTAQLTIDGRSDEAAKIVDLATDLLVYRDGVKVFRGRIGPATDDIGPDGHVSGFTAVDYRGMLQHRFYDPADHGVWNGVDQGQIAWELIDVTQQRPGGDWGIVEGVGATSGVLRDRTDYLAGKPILEAVAELGRVDGGFEWEISPELELNRWYPRRGVVSNVVLDWGGALSRVQRLLDPGDFGNAALVSGTEDTTPERGETVDVADDPRGRWERAAGFPSVTDQGTLAGKADWLLGEVSVLRPEWAVTFTAGRWEGFAHVGLGDVVRFRVRSGRLLVQGPHRVVEMMAVLDDHGGETITAGLLPDPIEESS